MEKRTITVTIKMDVEIDGNNPGDDYICEETRGAMDENMPHLICDDAEEDCQIWLRSWEITKVKAI